MRDREETILEDLDGNPDMPSVDESEFELDDLPSELEVEVTDDSGDEDEQPTESEDDNQQADIAAQQDEDQDQDDDTQSYSKRVRKRIERERRIAREAREEAAQLRQTLENERAERVKAMQAVSNQEAENLDRLIAEKTNHLKEIREEMDPEKFDEEMGLMDELMDLKLRKRQMASERPSGQREQPSGESDHTSEQPTTEQQHQPNPLAVAWAERNDWFGKPAFRTQTVAAQDIDMELAQEGYNPGDPEYFAELDRRLSNRVKVPRKSANSRSPVSGVSARTPRSKNIVTLDESDKAMMRKVGLDPKNKGHCNAFAQERLRTLSKG